MTAVPTLSRSLPIILSLMMIGSIPLSINGSQVPDDIVINLISEPDHPVITRNSDILVSICTWYGDREGALSFTFDDGLSSQADLASPALKGHGLNGTFFVTVGNVGIPYGAEWSEWQEASDYGHEIGAHTITHPDLTTLSPGDLWDEVVFAKLMIEANLTDVEVETMSYPMGMYNSDVTSLVTQHYLGARGDRHNVSASPAPNPDTPENIYGVVPVNFGSSESLREMNDLVDDTVESGGWLVEMIHAVRDGGYDPVPFDTFADHLENVSSREDRLWVGTYGEVTKYIRARDSSVVNIVETSADRYDITLNSPLDPEIFDQEITVKLMLPMDWVDVSITRKEMVSLITPDILGGAGTIVMNMNINETITVEKVNVHPVISIPSDPGFDGRSFAPGNGSSGTVFEFGLEYISMRNRGPLNDPRMSIDINGDGDFSDMIGDFSEGDYSMIRMEGGDIDYTDGCGYHMFLSLPPGSDPVIVFNALDSMRLEATGVITSEIPGPHMNDPPGPPSNLRIESLHDLTPEFAWDPSVDPDGDVVVYSVELKGNDTILRDVTEYTEFELIYALDFNTDYTFTVYSIDNDGAESGRISVSFNLVNSAPGYLRNLSVDYDENLILTVSFSEAVDPDGDRTYHRFELFEDPNGRNNLTAIEYISDPAEFILDKPLTDHTDYRVRITAHDYYGLMGPVATYDFRVNIPPAPVLNLSVKDVAGMENALDIFWDPSPEDDIRHYIVIRDDGVTTQFDVGNTTSFRDSAAVDGTLCRYGVAAMDMDGAVDLVNITYVNVVPIDDVAPVRITNLTASDLPNSTSSLSLKWDASIDGRFHHYRIYKRTDASSDPVIVHDTDPGDRYDNSWIDLDVVDNITYYYAVTAVDESGNEDTSDLTWIEGISIDDRWVPHLEEEIDETVDCRDPSWIPVLVILLIILGIVALIVVMGIYLQKRSNYDEDHEFD